MKKPPKNRGLFLLDEAFSLGSAQQPVRLGFQRPSVAFPDGQVDRTLLLFGGLFRRRFLFRCHGALQLGLGLGGFGTGLFRCWHRVSSSAVAAAGQAPNSLDEPQAHRFQAL